MGGRRILLIHDIGDVANRSVIGHEIVVHGSTHQQEMKTRGDTLSFSRRQLVQRALLVCGREGVLLQPPPAEEREQRSASLQVDVQAAQDDPLILFVRHAEALAQAGGLGVLPEDAEAQRVQRSPRHLFRPIPEGSAEPHGDLLGGFVGERHGADPGRRETEHLDKMADPADQAESLAGARTGHHEHRAERGLDGGALLREGVEVHHARPTV